METIVAQMFYLIDTEKEEEISVITEAQIQFLIDNLAEAGVEDQEYYIDEDTLDFLAESGCDKELLSLFTDALEGRTDITVHYEVR